MPTHHHKGSRFDSCTRIINYIFFLKVYFIKCTNKHMEHYERSTYLFCPDRIKIITILYKCKIPASNESSFIKTRWKKRLCNVWEARLEFHSYGVGLSHTMVHNQPWVNSIRVFLIWYLDIFNFETPILLRCYIDYCKKTYLLTWFHISSLFWTKNPLYVWLNSYW